MSCCGTWKMADLPVFFEHQLDPEATHMAGFPSSDRESFMAHWNRILEDESVVKTLSSSRARWLATS